MPFRIVRNDITKVKADAIVNTANPDVAVGRGVDTVIYNAAGREKLMEARESVGPLLPGEVGITPAFALDAKYIIHVSGPWWEGGNKDEESILRKCYDKSLSLAKESGCESIAFPLLATGTYGFPKELGMQIAVDSFTDFLEENEMEITLVVFGSESFSISGTLVDEVRSYIDDEYVEEALDEEYEADRTEDTVTSLRSAPLFAGSVFGSAPVRRDEKRRGRKSEPVSEESDERTLGRSSEPPHAMPLHRMAAAEPCAMAAAAPVKSDSLEDVIKGIYTDSFEKHLQQLINKKGLKNSEVYAAANISKQYFSKLLKGQVKPSKEKVLALAVGLRLNLDETTDFLRIAGYALSPISQADAVVEYFIEHEDYSVMKIDIVLFDYGLDPLSNS